MNLDKLLGLLGAHNPQGGAPNGDPLKAEAMRMAEEQLAAANLGDAQDPMANKMRIQYFNQFYRDLLQKQMQQQAPQ